MDSQSFYIFDLDDNVFYLETQVQVRHMTTGEIRLLSTTEFAAVRHDLGKAGRWGHYEVFDRTYERFRDLNGPADQQHFVNDLNHVMALEHDAWKGPAWSVFEYACAQQRPLSIITARGHSPETIRAGITRLVEEGLIAKEPNYLDIFAVGNQSVASELKAGASPKDRIAIEGLPDPISELKRLAIHRVVAKSIEIGGADKPHRFGMSDDDPGNVDLVIRAMLECKRKYPDMRFFVINTHRGEMVKLEVFPYNKPVVGQPEEI
ncbi:MAG: hypothetical protein AAF662_04265 [Pseudomonadota bacterium]